MISAFYRNVIFCYLIGADLNYRREIDGLRAIAIIPVIFFHAGFKVFAGGFVGVDVFFVVSGYLITTIILNDMNSKKFSILTFYERRARRILPALFFMMFCCLPFAWRWLPPDHLIDFCHSLLAVSAFSSNILFCLKSGYFGTKAELVPLLHTWSLSVEEQYYFLFPLFLMVLWKLRKRWIFGSLMTIAIVSLIVAQWGAYNRPSATFFFLPTRGWELAIGALIAFYFLYKREHSEFIKSHKISSEVLGSVGLALICYSILAFNKSTPFPSLYALIPTIGTALIIIFSNSDTVIGRLLSTKSMVGIGLISYSTYLWHQPLFVFSRHISLKEPSGTLLLTLSIASFFIAYLSWRYIEMPFRDRTVISRRAVFSFALFGSLAFAVIGVTGHFNNGFAARYIVSQSILDSFKEHQLLVKCDKNFTGKDIVNSCLVGSDASNAEKIAVFGDSHSISLLPAFDVYGKQNNYSVMHIGLAGCPPLVDVDIAKGFYGTGVCENLSAKELNYVKENNIKKVFLVARWSLYTDGDYDQDMEGYFIVSKSDNSLSRSTSRANFEESLDKTVKAYNMHFAEVNIVLQVPQQDINPKETYYKLSKYSDNDNKLHKLSVSYQKHLNLQQYNRRVIYDIKDKNNNVNIINFDSSLCNESNCYIGEFDRSFYIDSKHLSPSGAMQLVNIQ